MQPKKEKDKNKAGLTIDDYKCPKCGDLHATSFVKSYTLQRCKRCHYPFKHKKHVRLPQSYVRNVHHAYSE